MASSFSVFLSQLLLEGKNSIGEIALGNDFSLRHREDIDVDASELRLHQCPESAHEIARYDATGNYRPLKTAPNLRRGWLLQLQSIDEMALAIDFFYPAALSLYEAQLENKLEITSLRETLGRQTGMYRVTQQLADQEAVELIKKTCRHGCLRKILWPMASDEKAAIFFQEEKNEIPLLCREACNLLVAAARKVVKENSRG